MGDHTEVVQIDFDPSQVTFEALLEEFWREHTPTRPPYKRQYRSVILFGDQRQQRFALASRDERAGRLGRQLFTDIEPLTAFTRAEDYHQKYYLRGTAALLSRLGKIGAEELTDSTLAARLNAFAGGYGVDPRRAGERAASH